MKPGEVDGILSREARENFGFLGDAREKHGEFSTWDLEKLPQFLRSVEFFEEAQCIHLARFKFTPAIHLNF